MEAPPGPFVRRRGAFSIERGLGIGVTIAIIVGVALFFFQARGALRFESTLRLAGELITEVRSAHRASDQGMPDAPGMAAYLAAADAIPSRAVYQGDDPSCAARAPWGGCIALTSEVTGAAEYMTFTFHDIPRAICRRLMAIGPDGGNVLGGTAVSAATLPGGGAPPREAAFPIDADTAADLCRGAGAARLALVWPK